MKERKRPGRPPKIAAPEVVSKLLEALEGGNTVSVSCAYAGMSERSYFRAMAGGGDEENEDINGQFRQFRQAAIEARTSAEMRAVKVVTDAFDGPDALRASTWYLEHSRADSWGCRTRLQVAGDPEAPLQVTTAKPLSADEWLKKFHGAVAAAIAVPEGKDTPDGNGAEQ